jgi:hypothetical protein
MGQTPNCGWLFVSTKFSVGQIYNYQRNARVIQPSLFDRIGFVPPTALNSEQSFRKLFRPVGSFFNDTHFPTTRSTLHPCYLILASRHAAQSRHLVHGCALAVLRVRVFFAGQHSSSSVSDHRRHACLGARPAQLYLSSDNGGDRTDCPHLDQTLPARAIPVLPSAVARSRPERPFGSNVLPFAML